ncbi:hypothetical protein LCGC14_2129370, partial [marine sediment metagenome]
MNKNKKLFQNIFCKLINKQMEKNLFSFDFSAQNFLFDSKQNNSRYKKFPKDKNLSKQYEAKTPELNYSEFQKEGIEYVDLEGREYILAKGNFRTNYVRSGDIQDPTFLEPDRELKQSVGTQIFWIRIPIYLRGTVGFPEPSGKLLSLYFVRDQILCTGETNGVYVSGPKKKTGFIVLKKFQTFGQVADPSSYQYLVTKEKRIK